jgi:EpsI family protein
MDHIIYGWFFFAAVIALVLALGWRFFDRPTDGGLIDVAGLEASSVLDRLVRRRASNAATIAAIGLCVVGGLIWASVAYRLDAELPQHIALPEVPGWQRVNYHPAMWWEPRARGANHRLLGRYADRAGHSVDVFVALYSGQSEGREAGGFGEGALVPGTGWAWQGQGSAVADGKSERLLGNGKIERLAQTYYRTGPLLTGSNVRLKLSNIADRLILRERPTMMLILSGEQRSADKPADHIAAFRSAIGPLGPWMDRIAAGH